ncbi:MAG: hypothetical protein Q9M36_12405 [Sulfurovum sp.]|nr:hypothetical protein [Sulfurovum sp.]
MKKPLNDPLKIHFKHSTVENLHLFSSLLKKDVNSILEEALEQYFDTVQKAMMDKNINDENAMTNLNYNEFWDDVDLDD